MSKLRTKKWFSPQWITHRYILLMLLGLPIWFWRGGYTDLTRAKFAFAVVLTAGWAILTAAAAVGTGTRIRMTADKWVVVMLVLCAGISSAFSPYPEHVWLGSGRYNGFLSMGLYGIIYIGVSSFGRMKRAYVMVFATALFSCSIIAILQLLGKNPLGLYPGDWNYYDKGIQYSSEFLGMVGNVDLFGALLCLGIPLAVGTVLFDQNGNKMNWLLAGMALVCLFVAVEMDVKATLIGISFGLLCLLIMGMTNKDPAVRKRTKILFAALIITILLASSVAFRENGISLGKSRQETEKVEQKEGLEDVVQGKWSDEMGSGRIGIWRTLIRTVPDHLWIGTGPGTVTDRADILYERYVPETGRTLKARVDNAHNEFLEYLVCEGLVGLGLYVMLIVITIWSAVQSGEQKKRMLAAMGSYWIQSFFGLGLILVLPILFIFWGLQNNNCI